MFFIHTIFFSIRIIHTILIQNSNISIGPLINIDSPMLIQRRKKLNIFFSSTRLKYFKRVIKISSLIGFNAAKGQWLEIYLLKKL